MMLGRSSSLLGQDKDLFRVHYTNKTLSYLFTVIGGRDGVD